MSRLFNRRCVVMAQAPDPSSFVATLPEAAIIDGLRVKFTVKRTLDPSPNESTIQVFNLSPHRRAELQRKGTKVVLQAGYEDGVGQIFSGDARRVENIHEGPNWITKFTLGDGERAFKFARLSETFAPGATVETVVRALAGAMKLDPGNAVEATRAAVGPGGLDQYATGYAFHGRAADGLNEVFRSLGLTWSIQDGRLQVLRRADVAVGETVLVSPSSGLIGSPAFGTPKEKDQEPRLTVKSLLQPSVRCGGRIAVESRAVKGQFKVHTLTHEGDTAGGEWYSVIECEAHQ